MTIKLDHFFVLTEPGAPQADLLSGMGWIEGTRNDHPGQGTANRRFFFPNAALELLYVRDAAEAAGGRGKRMRIAERAADPAASPFGLIVRETAESAKPPFPGWRYCPEYFRADQCFHVGENSDLLVEPLCVCMPDNLPLPETQPRPANPGMNLTQLRISVPVARPSATLAAVADCERVSLQLNEPHRLELVFNEQQQGRSLDLAPDLPLRIRW